MLQHGQEYVGQWIVLGDGRLIGHTADGDELLSIVDRARAEGIHAAYVEFLNDVLEGTIAMPRKIKELISDLEKAGFVNCGGKGSHRNY